MNRKPIYPANWKWYGTSGHFICGNWCRFHLLTVVGKYVISTIGAYVHPRHSQGREDTEAAWLAVNWPGDDVGLNRKYETMVFHAGTKNCDDPKCGCDFPIITDFREIDFAGYNKAGDATEGHLEMCKKWSLL